MGDDGCVLGKRLTGDSEAPPSTRIMQNMLMASSYLLENIPIWLRLTAFEEWECRRALEYICLVGTFRRHLLHVGRHNRQRASLPSAVL